MPYSNPVYKTITETVPEFFFVYDIVNKEITFISPRFYELLEDIPQDGPLHIFFREYICEEHRAKFDQFFADLSDKNNYTARIELKANRALVDLEWIELHTHPVDAGEHQPVNQVVGHILDVSERQKRMQLLAQENQKLDSVLKILAHDLRAPFSQVYMLANIIRDQMNPEEQERFSHYLNMLQNLGHRSLGLLESLLRLTALKEETRHLEYKKVDARELVQAVARQNELELSTRQQRLQLQLPEVAATIRVDRLLLEQALNNLLSNAMKFTPNGGDIRICLSLPKPEHIILEVEDTGIGIAPQDLPDLFKEFTRIRRRGVRGEKPVGLGLAICNQIIKLHKGSIAVESEPGKGTLFRIFIPS
jgi:two-component system, OmpR family, sensor histidine kinase VicK